MTTPDRDPDPDPKQDEEQDERQGDPPEHPDRPVGRFGDDDQSDAGGDSDPSSRPES